MIPAPTPTWNGPERLMPADKRVIGVDEAGKGDFFGPLVVAGVICKESESKKLVEYGVRDSKLIADKKILLIDEQLRNDLPHCVLVISPEEYNTQYRQIKNLNKLLAGAHAAVIEKLVANYGADKVILDKFGKSELVEKELAHRGLDIELVQVEHGERHPPVAAASILARAGFIRAIEQMSNKFGMKIPKGASALVDDAAKTLAQKYGDKALSQLVKIHFKNYGRVLSPGLFS